LAAPANDIRQFDERPLPQAVAFDESGEFTFSDATDPNQMVLFSKNPRYDDLAHQIMKRVAGKQTTVRDVEEFVLCETAFRERHYKRLVLREFELTEPPRIQVLNAPPNRRRGTFGESFHVIGVGRLVYQYRETTSQHGRTSAGRAAE
jgi:hypothetical protein